MSRQQQQKQIGQICLQVDEHAAKECGCNLERVYLHFQTEQKRHVISSTQKLENWKIHFPDEDQFILDSCEKSASILTISIYQYIDDGISQDQLIGFALVLENSSSARVYSATHPRLVLGTLSYSITARLISEEQPQQQQKIQPQDEYLTPPSPRQSPIPPLKIAKVQRVVQTVYYPQNSSSSSFQKQRSLDKSNSFHQSCQSKSPGQQFYKQNSSLSTTINTSRTPTPTSARYRTAITTPSSPNKSSSPVSSANLATLGDICRSENTTFSSFLANTAGHSHPVQSLRLATQPTTVPATSQFSLLLNKTILPVNNNKSKLLPPRTIPNQISNNSSNLTSFPIGFRQQNNCFANDINNLMCSTSNNNKVLKLERSSNYYPNLQKPSQVRIVSNSPFKATTTRISII